MTETLLGLSVETWHALAFFGGFVAAVVVGGVLARVVQR